MFVAYHAFNKNPSQSTVMSTISSNSLGQLKVMLNELMGEDASEILNSGGAAYIGGLQCRAPVVPNGIEISRCDDDTPRS